MGAISGYAANLLRTHRALMHHPPHRAIILDGRYSSAGVGIATAGNGSMYVVQVFAGP